MSSAQNSCVCVQIMKYEGGRNVLSVFFELLKMAWGLKDPKKEHWD